MDEKVRASWERALHPESLKKNIITASIFNVAFEMLKSSIVEKIKGFYSVGINENGGIVDPEYKKVLSLHRSPLYGVAEWLRRNGAIDETDLETFEFVKRCRNTLAHEMLTFASSGVDFDVSEAFDVLIELVRTIEIWWFKNLEMEINPGVLPI